MAAVEVEGAPPCCKQAPKGEEKMEKTRRIEVRGLKARLLRSLVDWEKLQQSEEATTGSKWPVLTKGDKTVELKPGTCLPTVKAFKRFNLFFLEGLGPVDFVPITESLAKVVKRWKYRI